MGIHAGRDTVMNCPWKCKENQCMRDYNDNSRLQSKIRVKWAMGKDMNFHKNTKKTNPKSTKNRKGQNTEIMITGKQGFELTQDWRVGETSHWLTVWTGFIQSIHRKLSMCGKSILRTQVIINNPSAGTVRLKRWVKTGEPIQTLGEHDSNSSSKSNWRPGRCEAVTIPAVPPSCPLYLLIFYFP